MTDTMVCSTRVEMNRSRFTNGNAASRLLHARGDEPLGRSQ